MENLSESLLQVWLQLSTSVINNRIVSDLPYRESLVCNMLYMNALQTPDHLLTATDLCEMTNMLKSQMNRTLNSLEEKKLIIRERSSIDKRQVCVKFHPDSSDVYLNQHKKILEMLDTIIAQFGEEQTKEIIRLIPAFLDVSEDILANFDKTSE